MKLSKRIQAIAEMVNQEYQHIWDCCCDHGYLGFELLRRSPNTTVHFVDIVPKLTNKISHTLAKFGDVQAVSWQVHCLDVGDLPLAKHTGKHLIIIAGVGGDLALDLVKRIQDNHPHSELEFLPCPSPLHLARRIARYELPTYLGATGRRQSTLLRNLTHQ